MTETEAYENGRRACMNFRGPTPKCSFSKTEKAIFWWNGYLDHRTELRLRWPREKWGDVNQRQRRYETYVDVV